MFKSQNFVSYLLMASVAFSSAMMGNDAEAAVVVRAAPVARVSASAGRAAASGAARSAMAASRASGAAAARMNFAARASSGARAAEMSAARVSGVHREGGIAASRASAGIPPAGGRGGGNGSGGKPVQPKTYSLTTAARPSVYHFNGSRSASSDHYFYAHDAPFTTYRPIYVGGGHGSAQKQDDPAANDELQNCIKHVLLDQMLLSADFIQSSAPKILSLRHKFDQATPEQKHAFQNGSDQLTGQVWTAYKACNYK